MPPDPGAPLPLAPRGSSFRTAPDFAQRVPSDLEPIFRGLPTAARTDAAAPARIVRPSRPRRDLRLASLGAIVAASLAGLSAGALVGRPTALFGAQATPASAPAPTLQPIAALDAPSAEATARLVPAPQIPAETSAPRIEASAPAAPAAVRTILARARPAAVRVQKAKLTRSARHRRGDVMAADRELRRAYARAIRVGAPNRVLVAYRDQWDELRHQASYSPREAADGYWRLSQRLDKVSDRVGSGRPAQAPAARRRHGPFHLW